MKRIHLSLVLTSLFLTACGTPSAPAVSVSMTETQSVVLTSTPAPISSLDFSSIVMAPGELPAGYQAGEINAVLGELPGQAPAPDAFFSQNLSYNDGPGGQITILLYEDELKIEPTYELIVNEMPGAELVDVGEIAKAAGSTSGSPTATLTFVRCHAVITIQWIGTSNTGDVLSYAINLDKRLSPYVCRTETHE